MADHQDPPGKDETNDTNQKEPSNEGSASLSSKKIEPPKYDPKPKKQAPGALEEDDADNPEYDNPKNKKKDLDKEILAKRKIGKWMTITAAVFLLISTATFFHYAIRFAHGFIGVLEGHVHTYQNSEAELSIVPFLLPFMPATLFAALGIATMVTAMRFVNAYVNAVEESNVHGTNLERLAREIAAIVKNFKSGGSE